MGLKSCARRALGVGSLCLLATGCLVGTEETPMHFGGPAPADPTGSPGSTGADPGPGDGSTSGDDSGTSHGLDPAEPDSTGGSTAGSASGGGTTGPDPTGGSTGSVDPSGGSGGSTGGADPSGGTGGEPVQPTQGMWAHCLSVDDCDAGYGCLTDESGSDGFCSILCTPVGDPSACGTPPGASVTTCTMAGGGESVCALDCAGGQPCPGGMSCSDTNICM